MVRLFIRHKVQDYAAWRKGYDDFEPARIGLGARGHDVFRDVDDGNDVTACHDFDSLEAAKAFVNSFELKTAMQTAGVVGAPTIWFTHPA
ncbi:MAG TPA: cyclase [Casimicrobiaceae bacterium]|nr:cyclase [Casimicrobiaceae bacterium]